MARANFNISFIFINFFLVSFLVILVSLFFTLYLTFFQFHLNPNQTEFEVFFATLNLHQ